MMWNIFEKPIEEVIPQPPIQGKSTRELSKDLEEQNVFREETREGLEFSDLNIDLIFEKPEVDSYTRISYPVPEYEGRELKPGHRLVFVIPDEFKKRVIRDVILRHRKSSKYAIDIGSDRYDPHGAYSRVEIRKTDTGQWIGWIDPAGYKSDKFAEPRSAANPEEEVLHDWMATVGPISADAVRVTNVGSNPDLSISNIHGLEIVFYPEFKSINLKERIYCPGTEFIEPDKGKLIPSYGGGSFNEGRYEGAIPLNQSRPTLYELGKNPGPEAIMENGKLVIKLDSGRTFLQAEVAVGDTEHLNYINPKTKRKTRLGYAKLRIGIRRAKTGDVEWFVNNVNVPPQGIIAGGPDLKKSLIEPGDELILESQADTTYVMGYRLVYKEN